jgi:hypothetical protein
MKQLLLLFIVLNTTLAVFTQGVLKIMPGASIQSRNRAYIVLNSSSLKNDGTLQFSTGQGNVVFTGTNDSIQGSATIELDSLQLKLNAGSILTLKRNISVRAGVIFTSGLLNIDNSIIDLGTTGQIFTESENNRAFTGGSGYIQATANLNAPASANPGNLGAIFSSADNLGSTTIKRGHSVQTSVGYANSIKRYYDITPTNNKTIKATLRLNYFDAELNGNLESSLALWRSANASWALLGSNSLDTITDYVEKNNVQTFTRMTLSKGCPAISVNIPDVYAVTTGGNVNTRYIGYGPASLILKTQINGGVRPYSYRWTAQSINGTVIGTDSTLTINPTDSTTYYLTVSDVYGCSSTTATKTIKVLDVRCGKNLDMVTICQKQANGGFNTNCVTTTKVSGYLSSGSYLGTCLLTPPAVARLNTGMTEQITLSGFIVKAMPNPTDNYFTLIIESTNITPVSVYIMDALGRVIESKSNLAPNDKLMLGSTYRPGVYIVRVAQGRRVVTLKLIKQSN